MKAGLRARLVGVVVLALLPMLVLIVWMNVDDRREKTALADGEIRRVVRLAVGEQARLIAAVEPLIRDMSQIPEAWMPEARHCQAMLREFHRFPSYSNRVEISRARRL